MASVLIGDGIVDVAVSFDDDEVFNYLSQLQSLAATLGTEPFAPPNFLLTGIGAPAFQSGDALETEIAGYINSLQQYAYDDQWVGFDDVVLPAVDATATFGDASDTLGGALAALQAATFTGAISDQTETLNGVLNAPSVFAAAITDQGDTLLTSLGIPFGISGTLNDQGDSISAAIAGQAGATLTATVSDQGDVINANSGAVLDMTAFVMGDDDTISGAARIINRLAGGTVPGEDDILDGVLSTLGPLNVTATLQDEKDIVWGSFTITNEPIAQPKDIGDAGDILRRKKPVIMYRPKAVQQLEEAQEELEEIRPNARVSANKKKVKAALAIVKAIEPPPSYAENIAAIETALKNVTRETAKHEGMQNALLSVIKQIQGTMAAIEAARAEQKKRNMRKLLWLI